MKDFKRKLGALCLAMSALTWSLPNVARAEIVKQEVPTVYKSGVDKIADACEGYTQQSCDVVTTNADGSLSRTPQTFNCCGKTECQNMLDPNDPTRCKVSRVFAHGSRDTCTEPEQVSPCGMSCCGKEDCASVCNNYRLDVCKGYNQDPNGNKCCGKEDCEKSACGYWTVTTEDMGTPGISCCGYLDCANKACGGYTYIESKVFPDKKLACCGKEDCEKRACGGATQTTGAYGGLSGLACCGDGPNLEGSPNCRLTECQNYIQTTSVSDLAENKKKLECCGPGKIPGNPANKQWGNCWQVHCDNYISTIVEDTKDENGKNGTSVDCCGYLDCLEKQCSGRTSVVPYGKGSEDAIQCCGEKQCEQIYLDSFPEGFDLTIKNAYVDRQLHYYADFTNHQFYSKWRSSGDSKITFNGKEIDNSSNAGSYDWVTNFNYSFRFKNEDPYWYIKVTGTEDLNHEIYSTGYTNEDLSYYLYQDGSTNVDGGHAVVGGLLVYDKPNRCFSPYYPYTANSYDVKGSYFGYRTCADANSYGAAYSDYTTWIGPLVQLKDGVLHIWFNDEAATGAHGHNEGLSARFEYMGNKYNCKYSQVQNYYYPYEICDENTMECGNGMPVAQAQKVCKKDFETKFFEWTERDYSVKDTSFEACGQYGCHSEWHYIYTQNPDEKKSGTYKADCKVLSYTKEIAEIPKHEGYHNTIPGKTLYIETLSCPEDRFFIDRSNYE